jgi:hypothetical protein
MSKIQPPRTSRLSSITNKAVPAVNRADLEAGGVAKRLGEIDMTGDLLERAVLETRE